MKKSRIIIRSVPMPQFYTAVNSVCAAANQTKYSVAIQENIIDKFKNKHNLDIIKIPNGKLGFSDGLSIFKFRIYEEIALPLSSFEIENFLNLFFFILPALSGSYLLIFPNNQIYKKNIFGLYIYILKICISVIFINTLTIIKK